MNDYSKCLKNDKIIKDFILGYSITGDGKIKVRFAPRKSFLFIKKKSTPWIIPYTQENENMLLSKMENQVVHAKNHQYEIRKDIREGVGILATCFIASLAALICGFFRTSDAGLYAYLMSSLLAVPTIGYTISTISKSILLKDLEKNIKFLDMKDKLNNSVRTNQNTLVDVSYKTIDVIGKTFPEKPAFNINSFNYVPFSDLEQIIENIDRNERLGFDYTQQEEPARGVVRKKIR